MAGYSGTPLAKKLGIKELYRCYVFGAPDNYFDMLSPLPKDIKFLSKGTDLDFVHVFVKDFRTFSKKFIEGKAALKKDGMMWISWPKKASRIATDLDENKIRDFGLANGLVDVKVCAVDEQWSGLKFVYRLADR